MRANGVPNYPDPNAGGELPLTPSINVRAPQFLAADQKCAKYTSLGGPVPSPLQTAQGVRVSLAFAVCMRAHGVRDFPDPEVIDGVATTRLRTDLHPDLNPDLSLFQRAQKACNTLDPGEFGG